jgi:large subunit ribosomal protein L3
MMLTGQGSGQTVASDVEVQEMALGLLGLKIGMTQVYDDQGKIAPVTVLKIGPCPILQIRDQKHDGYDAVQLGFVDKPRRKATRAERGHVAADLESKRKQARIGAGVQLPPKPNCEPQRYMREYRLDKPAENMQVGQLLRAEEVLKDVKAVDVTAKSKGRGTSGVMKRHGFKGLRTSHGVKKGSRQRGSIASNASNRGSGRPKKGIRMAGRYGNEKVTIRNLRLVRIDPDNNLVLVEGAVPGPNGGVVSIRATNKKKSKHYTIPQAQTQSAAKKAAAAKKKK